MDQNTLLGWTILGGLVILIFVGILLNKVWYGYDLEGKLRRRVSFDYQVELIGGFLGLGIGCLIFIPIIGGVGHNIPALVGIAVAVFYPLVVMCLRPFVYGERMELINDDMRVYRLFMLFSVFAGGYFTILSFSMLNSHFPLGQVLKFLVLGLFAQTVPLYFDVLDRFLPVNLGIYEDGPKNVNVLRRITRTMLVLMVVAFVCVYFVAYH